MSKNEKTRCCKFCGKLLLDEKVPICRRCFLEGRNNAAKGAATVITFVVTIGGTIVFLGKNSNGENNNT